MQKYDIQIEKVTTAVSIAKSPKRTRECAPKNITTVYNNWLNLSLEINDAILNEPIREKKDITNEKVIQEL